jgi:lipid-A-disaccharide synthase
MHIYLIAGETSGDQLGAGLMHALSTLDPHMRYNGVGGLKMRTQGLATLFPMEELSLMGFAEILPHIFRLKRRIREVADDIEAKKPDVVVTIDSPGFTFRVVALLRKRGYNASRFVHYVAPTVWAYKPERAAKTARLFDKLLTLFAFETLYFTQEYLDTLWVGHPAAWREALPPMPMPARVAAFPGSRKNELRRHLPLLRQASALLAHEVPNLTMEMPLPIMLHPFASTLTAGWPCPLTLCDAEERQNALARAQVALVKSGTMTLETALSQTPMLVFYKANPFSALLMRRMIRTPYVALPNILLNRKVIPEFVQEDATPEALAGETRQLLRDPSAQNRQKEAFAQLKTMLLPDHECSPSMHAAIAVLQAARSAATSSS